VSRGVELKSDCRQSVFGGETVSDPRKENTFREQMSLSIKEDCLQLLDGLQGAPISGRDSREASRLSLKAFGKLQQIDEVFQNRRNPASAIGGNDVKSGAFQDCVCKRLGRRGASPHGGGGVDPWRKRGKADDLCWLTERAVDRIDRLAWQYFRQAGCAANDCYGQTD
jgi:hypothetical protein